MGGYGSGRPALRPVIDGQRKFDIRRFRRKQSLIAGAMGVWTWRCDGEPAGQMQYSTTDSTIELRYAIQYSGQTEEIRLIVRLIPRRCRFGGRRVYLSCPRCGRTCEVIVMATSGQSWGCRTCFRLRYQSQRLAPADRMQSRAEALYARAGTDYGDGMVIKHKWMRWRTFNRLCDEASRYSADADCRFISRLQRFGFTGVEEAIADIRDGGTS
jgi:hypothetical protein